MDSIVSATTDSGIRVLTLARPPVNAMDLELLEQLCAHLRAIAAAPPSAVVIAGSDTCFSAGVDLKAAAGYGPDAQRRMVVLINEMVLAAYGLPCPVVGAITGHAIAGGLVLALCTDVRVAALGGRYGVTEVKVGVPYPVAAIGVVRTELTARAARVLALGSRVHSAEECVSLGVFDEALAPHAVLERAHALAAELAALPAAVYAHTKRALRGDAQGAMRAGAARDPLLDGWLGASG